MPRPVARCDDTSVLGVPFYVMEWARRRDLRARHARVVRRDGARRPGAHVRAVDRRDRNDAPPDAARDAGPKRCHRADEVAHWRERAGSAEAGSLVDLLDELAAIPRPPSGEPGVVHGDPKFANLVWRGSSLVALLDFEMTHNGEPLVDVGYLLYHFSELPIPRRSRTPACSTGPRR